MSDEEPKKIVSDVYRYKDWMPLAIQWTGENYDDMHTWITQFDMIDPGIDRRYPGSEGDPIQITTVDEVDQVIRVYRGEWLIREGRWFITMPDLMFKDRMENMGPEHMRDDLYAIECLDLDLLHHDDARVMEIICFGARRDEQLAMTRAMAAMREIQGRAYVVCDHGIKFDEDMCVRTNPPANVVRRFWPRLSGPCPLGCGYVGIGYASMAHYVWGDW